MRLTYKTDCGYYTGMPNSVDVRDALQKLATLEDIEDKLGIDLLTLFKSLEQGIWFRNIVDNKMRCSIPMCAELEISKKGLTLISMEMDILFYFKDYGKTWALTKEELQWKD